MIGRIAAIAINTFREAVRDRVLYGVIGFASAVLLFTLALAELSLNEQRRVVMDVGLATISLFSVLVAVFLGSSLLYKEIEKKTLYVILPKPIQRWEFLVGKYLGIVLTAFTFIAMMGAIQLWVAAVQADADPTLVLGVPLLLFALLGAGLFFARDKTSVLVPWSLVAALASGAVASTTDVELSVFAASLLLSVGEVMVVAAVATVFSSFSSPFLTGAFTLGVWLVGRAADDMATMRSNAISPEVKAVLRALSEIVPNLNLFVPGRSTLVTQTVEHGGPWLYVGQALGYGVLYTLLLLVLASLIFRRRDFL